MYRHNYRVNRWYNFINNLCSIDDWLHENADWLFDLWLTRGACCSFCRWAWGERVVWDDWLEARDYIGDKELG